MAKKGMRRPDPSENGTERSKNNVNPVPEIQGKAKSGKKTAGNNQWSNQASGSDNSERRDGPGGN